MPHTDFLVDHRLLILDLLLELLQLRRIRSSSICLQHLNVPVAFLASVPTPVTPRPTQR
jgi:hypothetical protein